MSQLDLFTQDELERIPFWDNYLICQATQASLGLVPRHALAVGVSTKGRDIVFHFQLHHVTEEDERDMDDIIDEFETIVNVDVHVSKHVDIRRERKIDPFNGVAWIYLSSHAS